MNLYSYCGNNPLSFTDPTGLFFNSIVTKLRSRLGKLRTKYGVLRSIREGLNFMEGDWIREHGLSGRLKTELLHVNSLVKTQEHFNFNSIRQIEDPSESNAYLHAHFSASMTRVFGIVEAKKFLDAHEMYTPGITFLTDKSTIMDLYNNMIGMALVTAAYNEGKTTGEIISTALQQGLLITSLDDPRIEKYRKFFSDKCRK
jgi:hypothetical protein